MLTGSLIEHPWALLCQYSFPCFPYSDPLSLYADASKFISGCMQALSAMVKLELPHVNVLTKMDICPDRVGKKLILQRPHH